MATHFTWSVEVGESKCPECNGKTVLVCAPERWSPDAASAARFHGGDEDEGDEMVLEGVMINEELSGHYCPTCQKLCSVSFNAN